MEKLPTPCNYTNLSISRIAILVAAAALSGCGGGGGGSTSVSAAAPIAAPSTVSTLEDVPASGTLTASDPDGDPLTYSIDSPPSMGSAVITDVATGTYTYTPDLDQNGTDSFTFSANDGSTDSNVETVTITINPVNDPPLAVGGCGSTPQAQTLAGTLSATDPDAPALLTYSLDADGSAGAGPVITAKGGTVTLTDPTTGAFTYQPDTSAGDKRGVDSFDYQVSDTEGGISSATETVVVNQTIMPLGDSITMGSVFDSAIGDFGSEDSRVGYREPLFNSLATSAYTFDFVGSLSHGWLLLSDSEHEGHGGWTAFDIAWGRNPGTDGDGVFLRLNDNPADIILLHAGTNDLVNTTENDIADILNEIDRWENSADGNPVTVILALIIDQDPFDGVVTTFNNNVLAMANSRAGDDIIIVDQQNALIYPADMSDTLHPNDNGYATMANIWFDALTNVNPNTNEAVLDKCP